MPRGMKRSITSIARDLANTMTRGGRKVIPTRRPGEDGGPSHGRRGRSSRVEQATPSSSNVPSTTGTEDEVEESEEEEEEEKDEEEGTREERMREKAEETAREEEEEMELAQVTRK